MGTDARRDFIRNTCCTAGALGVASSFSRFGLVQCAGAGATDFRALVCIFLFGGNDSNNLLVPNDSTQHRLRELLEHRGSRWPTAAWRSPRGTLLPITSKTQQYGNTCVRTAPQPVPELQRLFNEGQDGVSGECRHAACSLRRARSIRPSSQTVPAQSVLAFRPAAQMADRCSGQFRDRPAGPGAWRTSFSRSSIASSLFPPITTVAGSAIFCTGQQTQPYAIIPGTRSALRVSTAPLRPRRVAGAAAVADFRYRRFVDSVRQLDHVRGSHRQPDALGRAERCRKPGDHLPNHRHRRAIACRWRRFSRFAARWGLTARFSSVRWRASTRTAARFRAQALLFSQLSRRDERVLQRHGRVGNLRSR